MNIPYQKEYKNGVLQNPIQHYVSEFPNRKERRMEKQKERAVNNRNTCHLTVIRTNNGVEKYQRRIQLTPDGKRIIHYVNK